MFYGITQLATAGASNPAYVTVLTFTITEISGLH
jgi:hypothetical protein